MESQRKQMQEEVEAERSKIEQQVSELRAASEQLNSLYAASVQWSKLSEVINSNLLHHRLHSDMV